MVLALQLLPRVCVPVQLPQPTAPRGGKLGAYLHTTMCSPPASSSLRFEKYGGLSASLRTILDAPPEVDMEEYQQRSRVQVSRQLGWEGRHVEWWGGDRCRGGA